MGCCGEPAPHDEHAKKPGIKQERSCQDCFFLLLFIAFWGGMIAVAVTASKLGEPDRLFYGTDYLGNLCGVNNVAVGKVPANYSRDFTSKPYLFYLFVPPFNQYYKLCVESCPTQTFLLPTSADELICTYNTTPSVENIFPAGSCYGTYASRPILNRCFPTVLQNVTTLIAQKITSDTNTGRAADVSYNILSDVVKSWKYILISAFIALGLGFIWVFLLRLLAGVIVWLTILFVLAALAVTTYVCYQQSNELEQAYNSMPPEEQLDSQHYNILALRYLSYIIAAAAVIIFLMVLFLLRRIQIAIGIIKETSKAVAHMPSLFFFPIFIFILLTGLAAYWLGISALLGTAGNPTYENGRYIGYKSDTNMTYLQLYHLFGGFWTLNFILAIGQCTIAGSVASWYWVHDKKDTPWFPVWIALYRTFRYHLGSLAFGSLILAVVQFIRVVLAYLEKKFKGKQFWVARFVIKCMQCCFAYLERFIKFLNKNAYIMIAIYGYSFCHGARRGFELVLTNFLRVAALGFVSKFLMFLGRAAITATTCFISFLLLKANGTVSFYVLPVLLIGIIAFAVATAFMSVYDMAISTMLLCFCEDTDRNDGSAEKPYYMTDSLKSYMDTNHKMCRCCGSGNDDEEK